MAVRSMVPNDVLKTRVRTTFGVVAVCYVAVVGRLVYLQGIEGETIRAKAEKERTKTITLPVHRGAIRDRSGNVMAVSNYTGTLCFDPHELIPTKPLNDRAEKIQSLKLEYAVRKIARILKINSNELMAQVNAEKAKVSEKSTNYVVVKRNIPLNQVLDLRLYAPEDEQLKKEIALLTNRKEEPKPKLAADAKKPKEANLYLFRIQDNDQREYTTTDKATQIVGYVKDGKGVAGLEYALNPVLCGKPGSVKMEVDNIGREIPDTRSEMKPAQEGMDVVTTLDTTVQHIVSDEVAKAAAQYHPKGIAAVVVEPSTGDILALVSAPSFDPNPGKPRHIDASGEALRERTVASLYEPGSTLKTLTVAAALQDKIIHLDSGFYCAGKIKVGKRTIKCDLHAGEAGGHGIVTPLDLIRRSCNIGSAQIGMRMGYDKLHGWMDKFGLFTDPKLGLQGETGGYWSMDKHENPEAAAKLARVAFGHSITTTPLNVAMAYAAIANGGDLMKPRIVVGYRNTEGKTIKEFAPQVQRKGVLSPQTCNEMRAMLRAVVANGTGSSAAIQGYQLAGKTGTAKKYKAGLYVASFAGMIPADSDAKPRAVILVAVDEPHGNIYGGAVAAPVFREISRRLLSYWNVPEDDPSSVQYAAAQARIKRTGGH